jgi:hypothetical protein
MEGLKLSQPSWLAVLLACVLFIPEAFAIDVSLSVDDGGESASLESSYDVDTDVAVSEESIAGADQPGIENARSVSGTGNINAVQSYSGSSGYRGRAILNAEGASGTLQSDALLTSQNVGATQDISLSGNSVDTGMSLFNEGDSADLSVTISSGTIDSSQSIQTGSVDNRILANIEAQLILYRQLVNILSNEVNSLTKINTPTSSHVVLNGAANSYTGNSLAFAVSGGDTNNINVDDNQRVTGPDGSEVNTITQVTNAKSCDYKYLPNSIYSRENRVTLTVKDADKISATASVGKFGGQYLNGGSEVKFDVLHGSVDGYSNKAYFDGTNFIASQSANSASGGSSPYSTSLTFQQMAYYLDGESNQFMPRTSSSLDVTGYSNVNGFSSTATSGPTNSYVNQNANFASGTWVYTSLDGKNKEGDQVRGSLWNQGGTNKGTVSGYSDTVKATKNSAYSSQDIGSTSGNIINVMSWASDIQNGKPIIESQVSTYIENNAAIIGYSSLATAEKQALTNTYSTTSRQNADSASGNRVIISGEVWKNNYVDESGSSVQHIVDGLASSNLETYGGYVNGYWNEGSAKKMGYAAPFDNIFSLTSSLKLDKAQGDTISTGPSAFNNLPGIKAGNLDCIKANVFTKITGGSISSYSDSSNVGVNNAGASANINANGASIDVKSEVANAKPNSESIIYSDDKNEGIGFPNDFPNNLNLPQDFSVYQRQEGTNNWRQIKNPSILAGKKWFNDVAVISNSPQGQGKFEYESHERMSAKIEAESDSYDVSILPTIYTSNYKNAIILEPMYSSVNTWRNVDSFIRTDVFSDLVDMGYATTMYTDSAASKDKFISSLDKYNVALISTHMGKDNMILNAEMVQSTEGYGYHENDVKASELNYNPTRSQTLAILAGCGSFSGEWNLFDMFYFHSPLANAVDKATLSAGYPKSAGIIWNEKYMREIFDNMASSPSRMSFASAENEAWNKLNSTGEAQNPNCVRLTILPAGDDISL